MGIATSAGGLEALRAVLGALPCGFPAAVMVVQHLEARRQSSLPAILAGATALEVREAHAGERLRAGVVYVAPSDRHLVLAPGGTLDLLDTPPRDFNRPSADRFFESLARYCGDRAVAVILTGRLHDGSLGAVEVARCGGVVVAEDPATAEYPGMPASAVASGAVRHVSTLDGIARLLVDIVNHTPGE